MIKKIMALFSAFVLMLTASSFSVSANNAVEKEPQEIKIIFDENTSIKLIASYVDNKDINVNHSIVEVDHGEETITSGYVVNESAKFDVLWSDFIAKQTALLSESMEKNRSSESIDSMQTMLNAITSNYIKVSVKTNLSNVSEVNSISVNDIVDRVELIETLSSSANKTVNETKSARASNWVPSSGHAGAWRSQNVSDATYMEVWYRWDTAAELSTLTNDNDSTLEADLVFYNYDGNAMSTAWYDGNYTYTTNQPRPYQDTQAFDDEDEAVFSIGCSDASSLRHGVDYYWAAYGNRTSSNGCKAKVNFQRGHRILNSLYEETWNIYGDETVKVVAFNDWNTSTSPYAYF